tara:strand:+ start:16481 stop:17800 length:1320 start_codon:yes stop_codon:yes gene_type:complete
MIQFAKENIILFILLHIAFGYLASFSFLSTPLAIILILTSISVVFFSNNKNEEAFIMSAYIVGIEVFLRMVKGAPLFETGKYITITLLFIGLIVGPPKQKLTTAFPFYLLLLLLGIVFTTVPEGQSLRKTIAFNLSGPFMLGVCAIYFYKRKITFSELYSAFLFFLFPVFSMVTFIYFFTPNFEDINFGGASLGETSGGFGPNQVTTVLGFGIFIIGVFIAFKWKLTGSRIVDTLILMYFVYRGLLTFSRGGIITAGIAFVIFFIFIIIYTRDYKNIFKYLIIAAVFMTAIWNYTSSVTGGQIENRYSGRNASGIQKEDASSGRFSIIAKQVDGFVESPIFGIGVGNGKYRRLEQGGKIGTSHNEVTRLIEEHGLIGIFSLLMLIFVPISHFRKVNYLQKSLLVTFYFFWFLTINHSAMRIAFPGFIYALSLINIVNDE